MEVWKDIEGFEGAYQISDLGRVKSLSRFAIDRCVKERIIKPYRNNGGYLTCVLCAEGVPHPRLIHRLVGSAFIQRPPGKDYINHKNSNRSDNRAVNLEWCTVLENTRHKIEVAGNHSKGDRHPKVKLTEKQVGEILKEYNFGKITMRQLGERYNVLDTTIFKIVHRITWSHLKN